MAYIDLTGKRFGKLTALNIAVKRGNRGQLYWNCVCDCGNYHVVSGDCLRSGKSKSCGCARKNPPNKIDNREQAIVKQLYKSTIVKRSKLLGLDYNLTLDYYSKMIKQPCYYCGKAYSNYANDRFNSVKNGKKTSDTVVYYNGIDRIDSSTGYNKGNIVTCCKYCNTAKNTMTQEEFKEWIKRVYEHYC